MEAVLNHQIVIEYSERYEGPFELVGEELMILTHPSFKSAAIRLAQWKREKGIVANVFEVNDGEGNGSDTAQQIDDFIENRYNTAFVRPS